MASKVLSIKYAGDPRGALGAIRQIERAHATFGQKLRLVGGQVTSLGKKMSLGLTLPIAAFGKVAIDEFSEAQHVMGQTAAALKSTGGAANVTAKHVEGLSERIGKLLVVDDELVQGAENVLLTFTNVRNEVGKGNKIFDQATLAIADMSARLGTDLNKTAIQVGKALQDPIKGVSALRRVGVDFTEQQKEQIEKMVEANDVIGAQKLILAELTKEFGGSAAAAGRARSPMEKIRITLGELAEKVGPIIMPFLKDVARFVQKIADRFRDLTPEQRRLVVRFAAITALAGPFLIFTGKIIGAIGSIGHALKVVSAHPVALILAAAALIILNWDKVRAFFNRALAGIRRWFTQTAAHIRQSVDTMLGPIDEMIGALSRLIGLMSTFSRAARDLSDATQGRGGMFQGPGGDIRWHSGGVFRTKRPGGEGLAILKDREVILTPEQARRGIGRSGSGGRGGGDVHVHIHGDVYAQDARQFALKVADAMRYMVRIRASI